MRWNHKEGARPFILIAEDNADDRLLLQYAFRSAGIRNPYQIVTNGAEAITWLTNAIAVPENPEYPRPGLVVLDIQMPVKTGFDVLEWIRQQPAYQSLSVVVMSGLHSPQAVERALALGAHSYLFKPGDYSELMRFISDFSLLQSIHAC
jgi:CheY-like chemotaxis protein